MSKNSGYQRSLFDISEPPLLSLMTVDEIFQKADQDLLSKLNEDKRIEQKLGVDVAKLLAQLHNFAV
jgi:hypothetical protein